MSFNINTDKTQGNNPVANRQEEDSPVKFTRDQFTNSIISKALDKTNVTNTQKAQITSQALSIFDHFDANQDAKWSEKECDVDGGAIALGNFYDMVNQALKNVKPSDNISIDVASIVQTSSVGDTAGLTQEEINAAQQVDTDFQNADVNGKATILTDTLKGVFSSDDCVSIVWNSNTKELTMFSADGSEKTISLDDVPDEVFQQVDVYGVFESCKADKKQGVDEQQQAEVRNNMLAVAEKYSRPENGGYTDLVNNETSRMSINGESKLVTTVTLENDKGEQKQIMLDTYTGKEINV